MRTSLTHLQAQKKQDGLTDNNLFCAGLCRFSCHPLTVPFWAPSWRDTAAICGVCFALPHPLPKGRTTRLFLHWMNAVLGESHVSGCEQGLLTAQLLQNCTPCACLLTPHSPPHGHHVPRHMEGCGVSTETSWRSSTKPRHTEDRKTKALLWTCCTVQQEFHMELPQAPPNKSTCLPLNALPPPSTHSKTTGILW